MYRLNEFKRNVLIVADEVIFHAGTRHTIDQRSIEPSIIIAEERFIRPALGYDFYKDLLSKKNKVVTTGNKSDLETASGVTLTEGQILNSSEFLSAYYLSLWNEILWKLTAECVMIMAAAEGYVQFGSDGAIHAVPPAGPMVNAGTVTPELKSMKWSLDKKLMDRIDPLRESLHLFLCKHSTNYPLYKKPCDCDVDGVAYKRKTQFVTGLYDEDESCGCP